MTDATDTAEREVRDLLLAAVQDAKFLNAMTPRARESLSAWEIFRPTRTLAATGVLDALPALLALADAARPDLLRDAALPDGEQEYAGDPSHLLKEIADLAEAAQAALKGSDE